MRTNLVTEDYHPWLHAYSLCGPRSTASPVYTPRGLRPSITTFRRWRRSSETGGLGLSMSTGSGDIHDRAVAGVSVHHWTTPVGYGVL